MSIRWRDGINRITLFEEISSSRVINPDGSYSHKGFADVDYWCAILETAFEDNGVSDFRRRSAIRQAIRAVQELTEKVFIREYKKALLSPIKEREFLIALPVHGKIKPFGGKHRALDCRIDLNPKLSTKIFRNVLAQRRNLISENKRYFSTTFNGVDRHHLVFVRTIAASPHEAHAKAHCALGVVLGAYNFALERGGGWRFYSGLLRPLNSLVISPFMTVHFPSGILATNSFFYHGWFPSEIGETKLSDKDQKNVKKVVGIILNSIEALPWGWHENAHTALRWYHEAFSNYEPRLTLVDSWRLLELVGGFSKSDHKTIVRRAASFFVEYERYLIVANHLKHRRNLATHSGEYASDFEDTLSYQMRELITPILSSYLKNPFEFSSEDEFFSFCDLACPTRDLALQRKLIDAATVFRRIDEHP